MTDQTLTQLAEKTAEIADAIYSLASLEDQTITTREQVKEKLIPTQQTMREVMDLVSELRSRP